MSVFLWIKSIHVGSVGLSIAGFIARGVLMLRGSPLLQARFVRVAPHVVDTALLASAVWLAWSLHQYPFVDGWITAKVRTRMAPAISISSKSHEVAVECDVAEFPGTAPCTGDVPLGALMPPVETLAACIAAM